MAEALYQQVFARLDKEPIARLAVEMGNIQAPSGFEQQYADWVLQWLQANGFPSYQQQVTGGRANVVGVLPGSSGGPSLLFNSHLDSDVGCLLHPDDWTRLDGEQSRGWTDGDRIYGKAVLNDRGPMACFMMAAKAIRDSGVRLRGDIILTMVAGEIGMAPIDEFQGPRYLGKGLGARHLVNHGVAADFAIVCETTDFGMAWGECGAGYYKITLPGAAVYTPRTFRPDTTADHPNAIVKAAALIQALEEWGRRYERDRQFVFGAGTVVPKINIGGIRGGTPFSPSRSAPACSVYVDVRIPPHIEPPEVERELRAVVDGLGLGAQVRPYMIRKGYVARGAEPLLDAIGKAHETVRGSPPPPVSSSEISMWRDLNIFNEVGISAVTFGPPRRSQSGGRWRGGDDRYFTKDDLLEAAKIYALAALAICEGQASR